MGQTPAQSKRPRRRSHDACVVCMAPPLKILQLNYSYINGCDARADYLIHQALRDGDIGSSIVVNVEALVDMTVYAHTCVCASWG